MKKIIALLMLALAAAGAAAAERKDIADVKSEALTKDTQAIAQKSGSNHFAIAWWIPHEFWQAVMSKDNKVSDTQKKALLDPLSGFSLLAVVQGDISQLGAFQYYTKEEVLKNMNISLTDANGRMQTLKPLEKISPDLEVVLGIFKPILGSAMGNFGSNMHFYVLNDRTAANTRIADPYQKGLLNVQLKKRNNEPVGTEIEMPLNALFVPRKCANGKEAHISWKYCPWTGEQLPD